LVVVFDLEGVLIDNKERLKQALGKIGAEDRELDALDKRKKRLFWRYYFNPELADKLDAVNQKGVEILLDRYNRGKKIIILSGSPKEIVMIHIQKIKAYLQKLGRNVVFNKIIWRPKEDRRKANEFKLSMIKNILAFMNEDVEEVHDDNLDVIIAFKGVAKKRFLWKDGKIEKIYEDD